MKAVVLTGYGGIDKLEVRDVVDPRAERGAIVVRMAGGSVNPIDWVIRSGAAKGRFPVQFPVILGRDADVGAFAVGDQVLGVVSQGMPSGWPGQWRHGQRADKASLPPSSVKTGPVPVHRHAPLRTVGAPG
jgi:NADPH:quinone reductase-like Zn-dependent oxidoreductase